MNRRELIRQAGRTVAQQISRGEHSAWPAEQAELRVAIAVHDAIREQLDADLAKRTGYPPGCRFSGAAVERGEPAYLVVTRPFSRADRKAVTP